MQAFPTLGQPGAPVPAGQLAPNLQQQQLLQQQQQQAQQAAAAAAQFHQQITNSIVHLSATLSLVEHLDSTKF